jgi:SSS family solute:Na+ symporter/sodium/pantothenate symporter
MPEAPLSAGYGTVAALFCLIVASVWLGTLAQRAVRKGSFLKGYFLGNRGLGSWTLALTATVQSGGTFMGFPSLVYSHGWTVALWISAYMVVPLTGFGVLGKRLAQLSRRTGAITVPDLLRERFGSPRVGFVALFFILLFMAFMMVAQFKAGALIMKVAWPGTNALALDDAGDDMDTYYYVGLVIFATTVIGYTLIGGFLAAVWTDLFQSVLMLFGVLILLFLVLQPMSGGLEQASRDAISATGTQFAFPPGYSADPGRHFLPLGLAFSFFFVWTFSGLGSPAGTVRIMACKDTATIRRSISLLSTYNFLIYVPLIVICICGRAMIPNLPPSHSDEIVPRLALSATNFFGGSVVAGIILAAPFGAVMATVSSYLVVIASGLVRDFYHRFLNPDATEREIRRLTYATMIIVGAIAFAANLQPVAYLQAIVVFSGAGAATTFVMPALMAAYWRRATAAGCIAAMIVGAGTSIGLYATGSVMAWLTELGYDLTRLGFNPLMGQATKFRPYFLLGLDPIIWGLTASLVAGVLVSLFTRPPEDELVSRLFDVQPQSLVKEAVPA